MGTREREDAILDYLREQKEAGVAELASALFVSEPTVRRDLALLADEGKLIRTHGGAVFRYGRGENLPQALRERERSDAKAVIAKKCLSLISDGDTVMLDGSSTAAALLPLLAERRSLVAVTNNANAPHLLMDAPVRLFVTGGEPARGTSALVGSYAEELLRSFNADVCFFSVRTLTREGLLTDNALAENAVRRVMLSRSRRRVLMLDSKKLGEACLSTLCDLSGVDLVVSERDLSECFPDFAEKFL